jgi:hypothetical protein
MNAVQKEILYIGSLWYAVIQICSLFVPGIIKMFINVNIPVVASAMAALIICWVVIFGFMILARNLK